MDILVGQTLAEDFDPAKEVRYTDSRKDGGPRCPSKPRPCRQCLRRLGKVPLAQHDGLRTPFDEASAACARPTAGKFRGRQEGVMMNTTKMVEMACLERLPITLVVNKVDLLILGWEIPPNDAYYKLVHTIEDVNSRNVKYWWRLPSSSSLSDPPRVSPNTATGAASAAHGWRFSLGSFAKIYTDYHAAYGASSATDLRSCRATRSSTTGSPSVSRTRG